ncbi:hypothetical protein [Campylobacter hepaticus]|nr:hypothetical protein [Campylobacter hepaticus]
MPALPLSAVIFAVSSTIMAALLSSSLKERRVLVLDSLLDLFSLAFMVPSLTIPPSLPPFTSPATMI